MLLSVLGSALFSLAQHTFLITCHSGFVAPLMFCILNVLLAIAAAPEQ